MNIDDPKLTAFALEELDEPEKSAIAREIAQSPDAQRMVDETRQVARALKNEFAMDLEAGLTRYAGRTPQRGLPASLSDIQDDRWFWSIGRPLAIAAVLAIFAIIAGVAFWTRRPPSQLADRVNLPPPRLSDIEAEFLPMQ